jgi:CHASE2 domain-containing sensor protein
MPVGVLKQDGVMALVGFVALAVLGVFAPPRELERAAYDAALRMAPERRPDSDVVIVAIDDAAVAAHGAWPWSDAQLAKLIDGVNAREPRVVGLALALEVAEPGAIGAELATLRGELEAPLDPLLTPPRPDLLPRVDAIAAALDPSEPLVEAVAGAKRVVLAIPDLRGNALVGASNGAAALPPALAKHAAPELTPGQMGFLDRLPPPLGMPARHAPAGAPRAPATALLEGVGAVGFIADADADGGARTRPLARVHRGQVLPSFALAVAASASGGGMRAASGELASVVALDGHPLALEHGRFRPYWYPGGRAAFPTLSAAEVIAGNASASALEGKIVIVGVTASGVAHGFDTPVDADLPAAVAEAHAVSALRLGDLYHVSALGIVWQALLALLSGAALWLLFGRTRTWIAFSGGAVIALSLALLELGLLIGSSTWLPLIVVAQTVVGTLLLVSLKHGIEGRSAGVASAKGAADLEVGEMLRAQGNLDKAHDRFMRCPPSEALTVQLYQLGLDFERKRQFNKAGVVFERIRQINPAFQDAAARADRNKQLESTVMLGTMAGTIAPQLLQGEGTQKPRLGRYELEKELGKGAMGTVYLGKDPRIGRVVAIKTMPLNVEFEGAVLEEMRGRFFREAQAAGRLSHANIVTVYDVGEEHDLAYMAMDYLTGVSMAAHCKSDALLDIDDVFAAMIQVAEALDYAHSQKVVHRDIKPANIIWDPATKRAKLTDFGVACLIDASKTKTGTVLGSPYYMSPEQVAGSHVDGRSDIFSLGVTMYQLFSGELPFKAPQMTTLMYKIANEKHPDVRNFNPRLAPCVGAIINTALAKDPAKRFPSAGQFGEALKMCRKQKPAY